MERFKVCVAGAGIIGSGLGVNAAVHGFPTVMQVYFDWEIDVCKKRVADMLKTLEENDAITAEQVKEINDRITYTTSLEEAVTGSGFIIEGGPEKTEVKQKFYDEIEKYCGEKVVISSTTTGKMPSELQEKAAHPERILVGHPYNPAYLLPVVELCAGTKTNQESMDFAREFFTEIGKEALICNKEISGYIINRVNWAVNSEGQKNIADGVCTVEDFDKALMYGPGLRMAITGQLLTLYMGVEGGFKAMAEKYGFNVLVPDQIDAGIEDWMAKRTPEEGRELAEIAAYRDSMIIKILKLQGKM